MALLSGVVSAGLLAVDSGSEALDGSGALVDGAEASTELLFSPGVVVPSATSLATVDGLLVSLSVVVGA